MPSYKSYRKSTTVYERQPSFGRRATYIITDTPEPRYCETIRPILVHRDEPSMQVVRRRRTISRDDELDLTPRYPTTLVRQRSFRPHVEYELEPSRSERRDRHRSIEYIERAPVDYDLVASSSTRRVRYVPETVERKTKNYYRDSDGNWLRWRKIERDNGRSSNFFSFL